MFVGKCSRSDEFLYLTERGVGRSNAIQRKPESERWSKEMLDKVRGTPRNP